MTGSPGKPVAAAPLLIHGYQSMSLLASSSVGEPVDLLYRDPDALDELVDQFVQLPHALAVPRMRADSPTLEALGRAYGRRRVVRYAPAGRCPYIVLDDSWREPESKLSSRRRSDLRRARRRAEQLGELEFETVTPTPDELEPLLADLWRIEASGWKGRAGTALRNDRQVGAFFRDYATAQAELGLLRMSFMRVDGRAAAAQLGTVHDSRMWIFKLGYDEEFAATSPGMLITCEAIRYAAEQGLAAYEFGGHEENWTRVWTKDAHQTMRLYAYPLNGRGLAAASASTLRRVGRRVGVSSAG
jgi:CelD/BcsL family acetyltransferase involved in cellulose biosynthesis